MATRGPSLNGGSGGSTTINANSTSNANDNSTNTTAGGKQTLGGKVAGAVSKATSLATAGQSALGGKVATNQSKVVNNASTNLGATNSRTNNDISAGVGDILMGRTGGYNQNNVKQVANEKVSNNNTKVNRGGAIATSNRNTKPAQRRQQQKVQTQQVKQRGTTAVAAKALGTKIRSTKGAYGQQKAQRRLNTVKSVHAKSEIRNIAAHPPQSKRSGNMKPSDRKDDSGDWI